MFAGTMGIPIVVGLGLASARPTLQAAVLTACPSAEAITAHQVFLKAFWIRDKIARAMHFLK
jgi:hypothetical protein